MTSSILKRVKRAGRLRHHLKTVAANSPDTRLRLSVHRSDENIYAQIIDDEKGETLISASSIDKKIRKTVKKPGAIEGAVFVGTELAKRAVAAGITDVYFDRSGFRYHGRVKAFADAAREAGLKF